MKTKEKINEMELLSKYPMSELKSMSYTELRGLMIKEYGFQEMQYVSSQLMNRKAKEQEVIDTFINYLSKIGIEINEEQKTTEMKTEQKTKSVNSSIINNSKTNKMAKVEKKVAATSKKADEKNETKNETKVEASSKKILILGQSCDFAAAFALAKKYGVVAVGKNLVELKIAIEEAAKKKVETGKTNFKPVAKEQTVVADPKREKIVAKEKTAKEPGEKKTKRVKVVLTKQQEKMITDMRKKGESYVAIDTKLGYPNSHGNVSWKFINKK